MGEKFYDIIPPEEIKERGIDSFPQEEEPIKKYEKKGGKKKFFVLFIIIAALGIFSYLTFTRKAEIEITPNFEYFGHEIEVVVDKDKATDLSEKVVLGRVLLEENSLTKSFPSSGKVLKESKAKGVIRVFNEYSSQSQAFREETRFMSASGKVFRTPVRVVIPGKRIENGEEVPGQVDIEVIASESGEEYNIEPTTFSIPGLAGTALYTKFYAKSFEPMKGGFKGETAEATEADLAEAEEQLEKVLRDEAKQVLNKKAEGEKMVLLEGALIQEPKKDFSLVNLGQKTESFECSASMRSAALVFKEEDIKEIIKDFISSKDWEDRDAYYDGIKINYKVKEADFSPFEINSSGRIVLGVDFSIKTYPSISELDLKKEIKGKKIEEAQFILEQNERVLNAGIKIWPFWISKIPENSDRIRFKLTID